MLTEERFAKILSILERMGSVTVQQLMMEPDDSESTVRRDLNTLDASGQLIKVHGGADDGSHCETSGGWEQVSRISSVAFVPFEKATVITMELKQEIYKNCSDIIHIEREETLDDYLYVNI